MSIARPIEYDDISQWHVLRLARAPWAGMRIQAVLTCCTDPRCGCAGLDFDCTLRNASSDVEAAHLHFRLDLDERKSYDVHGREYTERARRLGEALRAELREEDWEFLFDHLLRLKRALLEDVDLTDAARTISSSVMDHKLTCVRYVSVFPFAYDFPFAAGTERWVVDDACCGEPDCDCHSVRLHFLRLPQPCTPRNRRLRDCPAVTYDYTTGLVESEHDTSGGGASLAELVAALKREHPALDAALAKRHLQLRTIFQLVSRGGGMPRDRQPELAPPEPPPAARTQPARNAPCPCGSGKKYKKCCGLLPRPVPGENAILN